MQEHESEGAEKTLGSKNQKPGNASTAKASVASVTVGRIVHYWDERRFKNQPLTALVTAVHADKTINVAAFNPDGTSLPKQGVHAADPKAESGSRLNVWSWPART